MLRRIGCIACRLAQAFSQTGLEIHHTNLGGHAGQKRRGHQFTLPLCRWHHQGHQSGGRTKAQMADAFGPSLALQSKAFRERFGTDDQLLEKVELLMDLV